MTTKTKLPRGWERCRTGIKGVRKWRNMATKCWVTDHADDPDMLHCGVRGAPSMRPRHLYTPEQAMNCIDLECADHAESLYWPRTNARLAEDLRAENRHQFA